MLYSATRLDAKHFPYARCAVHVATRAAARVRHLFLHGAVDSSLLRCGLYHSRLRLRVSHDLLQFRPHRCEAVGNVFPQMRGGCYHSSASRAKFQMCNSLHRLSI